MKNILLSLFLMLVLTEVYSQDQVKQAKSYRKADSIAGLYPGHSLYNLPELAHKLTGDLTNERDQIRAIYTWVSTNISNDFDTYVRNKIKRQKYRNNRQKLTEWNSKISKVIFKNLLTEHKSICSGYSYLLDELAKHAGLNSKIINGYGKNSEKEILIEGNPNHSWNAVEIEGKWFLIDATWSSGLYKVGERKFVNNFSDTYFLVNPELFILTRIIHESHFVVSSWLSDHVD
ncbi:MAG: transglutaminase domain-containing protein, partial [Bacteroidota bacterium]